MNPIIAAAIGVGAWMYPGVFEAAVKQPRKRECNPMKTFERVIAVKDAMLRSLSSIDGRLQDINDSLLRKPEPPRLLCGVNISFPWVVTETDDGKRTSRVEFTGGGVFAMLKPGDEREFHVTPQWSTPGPLQFEAYGPCVIRDIVFGQQSYMFHYPVGITHCKLTASFEVGVIVTIRLRCPDGTER